MVDLRQLRRKMILEADAISRARGAWAEICEASSLLTEKRIPARFEYLSILPIGSKSEPAYETKDIPIRLELSGSKVLEDDAEADPETSSVHHLSDAPFYADMVSEGLIEDAQFTVDLSKSSKIIRFKEAVTGYEAYTLNQDLIASIIRFLDEGDGKFYICAGTRGRYDGCCVNSIDVLNWLNDLDLSPEIQDMIADRPRTDLTF